MPISRSGCLFVHIPKCAGTSIEVALGVADEYPHVGLEPTITKPHFSRLFGGGLQHLTIREIRRNYPEVAARPELHSFSIVRDPVDRFASHFVWKHYRFFDRRPGDKIVLNALLAEIERLVALARSLDLFQAPFAGSEYCEGDAQTVPIDDVRRHLLPQCAYLFDLGTVPLDAVYPISAMNTLERNLQRRNALQAPIPQRMVQNAVKSLRQMVPADAESAIRDVYRYDTWLHAQVCEASARGDEGFCPGTAIDLRELANRISVPNSHQARKTVLDSTFPRKLWMYWQQGWNSAPPIVRKCAESWLRQNPSWQIHLLTEKNVPDFIRLPDFYQDKLALPIPALSDVIRIHLLTEHGGVWADASTWCVRPLDEWLERMLASTGFFAYAQPGPDRPLSTWFIAAAPRHYIMERLKQEANDLWRQVAENRIIMEVTDDPASRDYFWLHSIFASLLQTDRAMADIWNSGPQIKAAAPHYLQHIGLMKPATADVKFHIRNKVTNVYKLSRRIELPTALDGTVLEALFNTL